MDDPYGAGSSLRGAVMNASRTESAGSGESRLYQLLLEVLVVVMCFVTVTGNTLVIATLAATKVFHTPGSALIVNLAISDLLVGVGVMPWVAVSIMNYGWADSTFLCFYVGYTSSVYCTASVLTMAVIALDRHSSIVDCLRYSSIFTGKRTTAGVLWIWVQALVVSFPPLLGSRSLGYVGPMFNCGVNWAWSLGYTGCVTVLSYLLPAIVILFCYMSIIRVARSHVRRIHSLADSVNRLPTGDSTQNESGMSLQSPSGEVWHVSGQFEASRQTDSSPPGSPLALSSSLSTLQNYQQPQNHYCGVLRLSLVISAFFLCWTPYTVVAFVQTTESSISGQSSLVSPTAVTTSYFLVLLSSAINPILYALLCRRFRVALRGLMQRTRARLRSVLARIRKENKRRYPCTHPRPPSTSDTDDAKCCSPVFTITDTNNTSREHLCNVYSCEKVSRALQTREDTGRNIKVDYLYVPPSPQEGSRLPFSALTKEREATFYFGGITVRVEHDVC